MGGWSWGDEPETPTQALERRNALLQTDLIVALVEQAIAADGFELAVSTISALHAAAMQDLVEQPGALRTDDVRIVGSQHQPPPWADVLALLEEMCAYANARHGDAVDQAAYVLWRLNWIHPFAPDGNGRTARAAATVLLFGRLRRRLVAPTGSPTFLERMSWRRLDYHDALEAADRAWARGAVDVSAMADLLFAVLRDQFVQPEREPP